MRSWMFFIEIKNPPKVLDQPLLYKVSIDPGKRFNIAHEHPEEIAEIRKVLEQYRAGIVPVENQLEK